MSLKIEKYVRKTFVIDAVQVTTENFEDVAKWCNGDVRTIVDHKGQTNKYVKVRVHLPRTERQTQAFVGDRVLYAGNGYKVYSPKAFENSFELLEGAEKTQSIFAATLPDVVVDLDKWEPGEDVDHDALVLIELRQYREAVQSQQTKLIFEDGARYAQRQDWEKEQTG